MIITLENVSEEWKASIIVLHPELWSIIPNGYIDDEDTGLVLHLKFTVPSYADFG